MTCTSFYRPSSSLIIATPASKINYLCEYELLLITRNSGTAIAPNHCVFPGGALEKDADDSNDWLEYFNSFGVTEDHLLEFLYKVNDNRRPQSLFESKRKLSRNISLRIAAIRETFEEVGILICCTWNSLRTNSGCRQYSNNFDRSHWQKEVHKNANNFLKLCKTLKVVPDLWNLHEWSVWRSPVIASKKFDTVYYITVLHEKPKDLLLEESEVELAFWKSPDAFINCFRKENIWLPPIIFYELSRFLNVPKWKDLLKFIYNRKNNANTLLQMIYYQIDDARIGVLPGDDFYSNNSEVKQLYELSCTTHEFRQRANCVHRLIIRNLYNMSLDINISPLDGHLNPISLNFCKL